MFESCITCLDWMLLKLCFIIFLNSAKRDGVHKEFQKAIEAAVCRYIPDKGVLSVMVGY